MAKTKTKTYLREWRLHKELTLEQAAAAIGLADHSMLSKMETGARRYNQTILERLAVLYGTDPGSLLNRDPNAPVDEIRRIVEGLPDTAQAIEMLKLLAKN